MRKFEILNIYNKCACGEISNIESYFPFSEFLGFIDRMFWFDWPTYRWFSMPDMTLTEEQETPEEYEERKKKVEAEMMAKYEAEKEELLNGLVTVEIE